MSRFIPHDDALVSSDRAEVERLIKALPDEAIRESLDDLIRRHGDLIIAWKNATSEARREALAILAADAEGRSN